MNKQDFLNTFRQSGSRRQIRTLFDDDVFLKDGHISLTEEEVSLDIILEYFVPKYEKAGRLDLRTISEQVADTSVTPLTVSQTILNPAKWGLSLDTVPPMDALDIVPVATDSKSGKSLILDSNHTIVSLIHTASPESLSILKIRIVRISGNGLDSLSIDDFKIINR